MVFTFDIYHLNIISRNPTYFMKKYQAVILLIITVSILTSFTYASAAIPDPRIVHATSEHSTIMGFTVPTNTTLVEIQGTHVVPEFPSLVPILLSSIIFVIAFYRIRFRPT